MVKKKYKNHDFSKIGENISALMEACNVDATELSQQTGVPGSTISRLRSNTTDFSPNLSSLLPIADFFKINLSQLIGEESIDSANIHAMFKSNMACKMPLPILDATSIHGFLSKQHISALPTITLDFPVSEFSFTYVLQGNSMEPHFPDKTLLVIDPKVQYENLDHLLVIPNGKQTPILRQILIDGDEKYLRALNPTFNDFIKLDEKSHVVLGVMIQSRRNFKVTIHPNQQNAQKLKSM